MKGKVELSQEQRRAVNLLENAKGGKCIFVTGKAGTGKSTLLKRFIKNTKRKVVVLAPTGVAAVNVDGSTIHSFFGFPWGPMTREVVEEEEQYQNKKLFNSIEMIVIDEVSMVRADLMDGIDYSLRLNRKNNLPFGGVQMVFFGDLFQLPPVVVGDELEYIKSIYGSAYFFNANVFNYIPIKTIELKKIFRQKDRNFKELLNRIRERNFVSTDLQVINQRLITKMDDKSDENKNKKRKKDDLFITLSSTNKIADKLNERELSKIKESKAIFRAKIKGEFEKTAFPTEEELVLKKGAQIMMVRNDPGKRWHNGSLGTVVDIDEEEGLVVGIGKNEHVIEPVKWEIKSYKFNKKENKLEKEVKGSFEQLPVKLAWAITIHKSQGKTFDKMVLDLGGGAFAHGQVYVALSRCRDLEGLILKKPITYRDIIVDQRVIEFSEAERV